MIAYEDLCQALDTYNAKRRNEAELAALDQETPAVAEDANAEAQPASVDEEYAAAVADLATDVGDVPQGGELLAETPPDEAPGQHDPPADDPPLSFAEQPPDDTQEIDVDAVDDLSVDGDPPPQ